MSTRYTKDHEWVRLEGDVAIVGITPYAVEQLSNVTYVELPEIGATYSAHDVIGVVESSKAASDLFIPIGGEIVELNTELSNPNNLVRVEKDPEGEGWFLKLKPANTSDLDALMDADAYTAYVQGL